MNRARCPYYNPTPSRTHDPPSTLSRRKSIHPLKVLWRVRQPLLLCQTPWLRFSLDRVTDCRQIPLILPVRTLGRDTSLHGPVNLQAVVHYSAESMVPADILQDLPACVLLELIINWGERIVEFFLSLVFGFPPVLQHWGRRRWRGRAKLWQLAPDPAEWGNERGSQ